MLNGAVHTVWSPISSLQLKVVLKPERERLWNESDIALLLCFST